MYGFRISDFGFGVWNLGLRFRCRRSRRHIRFSVVICNFSSAGDLVTPVENPHAILLFLVSGEGVGLRSRCRRAVQC